VPRPNPGGVSLRVVRAEGRYGDETPAATAAVRAAAERGLVLEPTYTGPTLATLLAERADGSLFVLTHAGSEIRCQAHFGGPPVLGLASG
jgi:hypothetical protein